MVKLRFPKSPFRGSTATANTTSTLQRRGEEFDQEVFEDYQDQHRQDEAEAERQTRAVSVGGGGVIRVAPPAHTVSHRGEAGHYSTSATDTPSSLVTVPISTPPRPARLDSRLTTPGSAFLTPYQSASATAIVTRSANTTTSARSTRGSVSRRSLSQRRQRHPIDTPEGGRVASTRGGGASGLRRILLSSSKRTPSQSNPRPHPAGIGTPPLSRGRSEGGGIGSTLRRAKSAVAHTLSISQSSPSMWSGGEESGNAADAAESESEPAPLPVARGAETRSHVNSQHDRDPRREDDFVRASEEYYTAEGMDAADAMEEDFAAASLGGHSTQGLAERRGNAPPPCAFGGKKASRTDGAAGGRIQHSPSEEENVPPVALLSPNIGTYYRHAAREKVETFGSVSFGHGSVGMDLDPFVGTDGKAMDCDPYEVSNKNVMEWMKDEAPRDVLPKILSFIGSRRMNALSKVNREWNAITSDDLVWRVVCEDSYKWVEGDPIPTSWRQHYRDNPCVPIDYDTVDAAFDSISSGPRVEVENNQVRHTYREQRRSARVLLYPGNYFVREALVVNCIGAAKISIEIVCGFKDPEHGTAWCRNYHDISNESTAQAQSDGYKKSSTASFRQMFTCRSASAAVELSSTSSSQNEELSTVSRVESQSLPGHFSRGREDCIPTAFLVINSRRQNEPIIRIRQGNVNLRGLKFLHYCAGADIWNGNAAIQVQPPFGDDDTPIHFEYPSVAPTVTLSHCDIMSMSGRGFVNIDGGVSVLDRCNLHNSAATGIYIGGTGSVATILRTDIVENGNGNERNRRGVARGHSGVYVEQGITKIRDCNISKNSLTGISAVSSDHATLQVEDSDLSSNGSVQLEMPPIGSPSRGRSYSRNNNISTTGKGQPRSLFLSGLAGRGQRSGPVGGHFPPIPQSPSEFPNDSVIEGSYGG